MLIIPNSLLELIKSHAVSDYPNECSGLIIGDYAGRTATKLFPAKNVHTETTRTRYQIDPKEYLQVEKQARAEGHDVIGIYHSHPDVPAQPSEYDRDHAWPSYFYIIVSVVHGRMDHVRAWALRDDRSGFDEEKLQVLE